ncbi:MAG: aminotransferase class IV, partial [Myxococcales bacterium]|nr:aminotransferase class IV [Myxococcales bacterium]
MSYPEPPTGAFGTVFASQMSTSRYAGGEWSNAELGPVKAFSMHPATHVFHYGSACFEGLKAHRAENGEVRIFRLETHVKRMQRSAQVLMLPAPSPEALTDMIVETVSANASETPVQPGSLYIRPTLIGTEPNIGAAGVGSKEALLYILCSPVGDYFAGGLRPLKIVVETDVPRTTPAFGAVKCGANYVQALGITQRYKREFGADQVLFAPGGDVQETGASNFLLIREGKVLTKALSDAFLHGVTRDTVLTLAREMGYDVEERDFSVDELLEWA